MVWRELWIYMDFIMISCEWRAPGARRGFNSIDPKARTIRRNGHTSFIHVAHRPKGNESGEDSPEHGSSTRSRMVQETVRTESEPLHISEFVKHQIHPLASA